MREKRRKREEDKIKKGDREEMREGRVERREVMMIGEKENSRE